MTTIMTREGVNDPSLLSQNGKEIHYQNRKASQEPQRRARWEARKRKEEARKSR